MPLKNADNVRKFNVLNQQQQDYFFTLTHKLIKRVDTEIGRKNFYGTKESVYIIIIWIPILLGLANVVLPEDSRSCVLPVNIPKQTRSLINRRFITLQYNTFVFFVLFIFKKNFRDKKTNFLVVFLFGSTLETAQSRILLLTSVFILTANIPIICKTKSKKKTTSETSVQLMNKESAFLIAFVLKKAASFVFRMLMVVLSDVICTSVIAQKDKV